MSRKILDNVVACDDQTLGIWIRLLSVVNWKRGYFKMQSIEPGQAILCDRQLQERLHPIGTQPAVNTIKRRLEQLAHADLITIGTLTIDGKPHRLVTVNKWQEYQSTASEINAESNADRRRKEGKKETTKKDDFNPLEIDIPSNLDSPAFQTAWSTWCQHRAERKPKLTPTATGEQIKQLAEWGPHRAVAAITHSVANGWQGIFEPSGKLNGTSAALTPSKPIPKPRRTK